MFHDFHPLVPWLLGLSIIMFVGSLIGLPILIIRLPVDYFIRDRRRVNRHPILKALLLVIKNLLGLAILFAGIVMLFTPGQGLLAIVVGISLLDFPGKHALEARLIRRPSVINALNKIRALAGREPLQIHNPET